VSDQQASVRESWATIDLRCPLHGKTVQVVALLYRGADYTGMVWRGTGVEKSRGQVRYRVGWEPSNEPERILICRDGHQTVDPVRARWVQEQALEAVRNGYHSVTLPRRFFE
jgi:hypothetical protein